MSMTKCYYRLNKTVEIYVEIKDKRTVLAGAGLTQGSTNTQKRHDSFCDGNPKTAINQGVMHSSTEGEGWRNVFQ